MFKITRCAISHDNTIKFDIYGTKGVLSFNLNILILYISVFSTDPRHLLRAAKAEMQNSEWSNEKNSDLHSCYGNLSFCKYVL